VGESKRQVVVYYIIKLQHYKKEKHGTNRGMKLQQTATTIFYGSLLKTIERLIAYSYSNFDPINILLHLQRRSRAPEKLPHRIYFQSEEMDPHPLLF